MFSDNQKISDRQMQRLLIYDMLGISTLALPGLLARILGRDAIFALALALIPAFLLVWLLEKSGSCVQELAEHGWLRYPICIFYSLEGILISGYGAYLLGDMMVKNLVKDESFYLVTGLLILLGGYGICQGIEGRARIYEILFWILLIPLFLMLLLAVRDVDTNLWTPVATHDLWTLGKGIAMAFLFYMIVALAFFMRPYLVHPEHLGICCRRSLIFVAAINGIICLILTGIFGAGALAAMEMPVITLMSMVKLPGGFLERQDVFMVAIWFFAIYALINTGMFYASELTGKMLGKGKQGWRILCIMVLTMLSALGCYHVQGWKQALVWIQFLVVLPVTILLMIWGWIRNNRKELS
ncbi:MAG: GerAB/ArcD/ProY family transporter [Roseburia sp.]